MSNPVDPLADTLPPPNPAHRDPLACLSGELGFVHRRPRHEIDDGLDAFDAARDRAFARHEPPMGGDL